MSTGVSRVPLTSSPIVSPALDLSTPHRIHVVGAGGSGRSAIAGVLLAMGHTVSGSDAAESPVLERLRAAGADVHAGHDAASVAGVDVVGV
jgi:UDP-N-acetylmuramate--alanine ligase